jgi:hypothetical protein
MSSSDPPAVEQGAQEKEVRAVQVVHPESS